MEEKRPLQKMFNAVPPSYDFLNRFLTFGFDQLWRKKAAQECLNNDPSIILDLCCGTGDLTIKLAKKADKNIQIAALDYSPSMLDVAKKKFRDHKLDKIDIYHADAANMPFPDNYFDTIGIAFAFRNLTFHNPDTEKFLKEIYRVLKSDGHFVIIETSQPSNKFFRSLFHFYLKKIAGPLGSLISGHHGAYKYLAHSAVNYYGNDELLELLSKSGFQKIKSRKFLAGISGLYIVSPLK